MMTQAERDLRADLIEMAAEATEDEMSTVVALLGAALTMLSAVAGAGGAAAAMQGLLAELTTKSRH